MNGRFLAVRVGPTSPEDAVEVQGIGFLPAALLIWEDRATLHIVADGPDPAGHSDALERWARPDRADMPPEHPCTAAFHQLVVALVLADGSQAEVTATSVGGSGSEWEAAVRFRIPLDAAPGPLVVQIGRRGGPLTKIPFSMP